MHSLKCSLLLQFKTSDSCVCGMLNMARQVKNKQLCHSPKSAGKIWLSPAHLWKLSAQFYIFSLSCLSVLWHALSKLKIKNILEAMKVFKHLHSRVHQNTVKADASLSKAMLGFNFLEAHHFSLQHPHCLLGQKWHARQAHDVGGFPA